MSKSETVNIRPRKRPGNAARSLKQYEGIRSYGQVFVSVNGRALDPRFDLRFHSPDGFEWGYGGSGPAQLALALLADCLEDDLSALSLYQDFKRKVVAGLSRDRWSLTKDDIYRNLEEMGAV